MAPRIRRPLWGGPLDGGTSSSFGAVKWFDRGGRAHSAPGPGRAPYLREGDGWTFAGHGFRWCEGCGASLKPDKGGRPLKGCPLCGAAVTG